MLLLLEMHLPIYFLNTTIVAIFNLLCLFAYIFAYDYVLFCLFRELVYVPVLICLFVLLVSVCLSVCLSVIFFFDQCMTVVLPFAVL